MPQFPENGPIVAKTARNVANILNNTVTFSKVLWDEPGMEWKITTFEEVEIETRFHFCKPNCIQVVSPVYSFILLLLFSIKLKIPSVSCWVILKRQRVAAFCFLLVASHLLS